MSAIVLPPIPAAAPPSEEARVPAQAPRDTLPRSATELAIHRSLVLLIVVAPFVAAGVAIWQLWDRVVGWRDIALLVGLYVPVALGVTVGFHRMLTHRSFRAHPVVRFVFLALGSIAIEGPAISWAANHLKHHAFSDQEGDPHSPLVNLWHAHVGWLFRGVQADPRHYCAYLLRDKLVVFVDRTFFLWVGVGMLVPFLLGGWTGLLWGGLVRAFFVHHVTWSVNSICHVFGSRAFQTTDRSRNQWVVGLLGMGEGWHNNHHAFPRSAIHGLDRWQVDISAWVIGGLEKLRLVKDVYRVPADLQARKRLSAA